MILSGECLWQRGNLGYNCFAPMNWTSAGTTEGVHGMKTQNGTVVTVKNLVKEYPGVISI